MPTGHLGVLRRRDTFAAAGRPAGRDPRRDPATPGRRGHRGVQSRGRRTRTARRLPRGRGDPDLARACSRPSPHVLAGLGRRHGSDRAVEAAAARWPRPGFASWNMDLIIGGAGETDDDWERSLEDVLGLDGPPPHLSAYSLTVEPGTPLAAAPDRHPDEDAQAGRYERDRPHPDRGRLPVGGDLQLGPARPRVPAQRASTGTRATTGASGRPPTPTGGAGGGGTSGPPTGTWPPSRRVARPVPARRCSPPGSGGSRPWPWRSAPRPGCRSTALPDDPDLAGLVDRSTGASRPHRPGPTAGQRGHRPLARRRVGRHPRPGRRSPWPGRPGQPVRFLPMPDPEAAPDGPTTSWRRWSRCASAAASSSSRPRSTAASAPPTTTARSGSTCCGTSRTPGGRRWCSGGTTWSAWTPPSCRRRRCGRPPATCPTSPTRWWTAGCATSGGGRTRSRASVPTAARPSSPRPGPST